MSDYENINGKLRLLVKPENLSFEDFCKQYANENGYTDLPSWDDSWKEFLSDELYKKVIICEETLYEVVEYQSREDCGDIFDAKENADGTIDFLLRYYNGGCGFSEAIEEALEGMKKRKPPEDKEKEGAIIARL